MLIDQFLTMQTTRPIIAHEIISLYNLRKQIVTKKIIKQQIEELISSIKKNLDIDNDYVVSTTLKLTESKSCLLFFSNDFEFFLGAIGPNTSDFS